MAEINHVEYDYAECLIDQEEAQRLKNELRDSGFAVIEWQVSKLGADVLRSVIRPTVYADGRPADTAQRLYGAEVRTKLDDDIPGNRLRAICYRIEPTV